MTRRPWTAHELFRACEMRRAGATMTRIAAVLGRTAGSVRGAIHRAGLSGPRRHYRKPGELARIVWRVFKRWGGTEAADRLGISRAAVYATIRKTRKHNEPQEVPERDMPAL